MHIILITNVHNIHSTGIFYVSLVYSLKLKNLLILELRKTMTLWISQHYKINKNATVQASRKINVSSTI